MAMINIPVWMFITSYKALRSNLLRNNKIVNMLHFGRGVFGSDFGSTAFVISKANVEGYIAVFQKLYLVHGAVDTVGQKEQWFFEGIGKYTVSQSQFLKIPSTPLAYWVSSNFINSFTDGKLIGKLGQVSEGIKTGDNDRFLRYWYEIQSPKFSFAQKAAEYKWVPYHKGGDFRKWFGNNTYAINWGNDGQEIRSQSNSGLQGKSMYFTSVVGYSKISARGNPMRYFDEGVLFDSMAPSILLSKRQLYVLGLLNTVVGIHYIRVLNPTMATQVGDIKNIPVIVKESETVENIVKSNISLSRTDWDNFETSWDFKRHPLL
ncbi:hypothetical protein SDC9_151287 [bioreactor metagenome]|uniref:site-specific DNA-methyltransferase (adenine-specific) n=1 Tax=bioreactor metagenome TaxID=1076179 RepID=A0A645EPV1_9ZZZZ